MNKRAFVFPGQGAQYIGMGKDFFEKYECARDVLLKAQKSTKINMEKILFEENNMINQTQYTQVAILAVELAILEVLRKEGIEADMYAGLSLGEYSALGASKAIEYDDLFRLVQKRGLYMEECETSSGAMSAIIGLQEKEVESIVNKIDRVNIANYNTSTQLVISGEKEQIEKAKKLLTEAGAKACIDLNVSGAFHSEFMIDAAKKLMKEIENTKMEMPKKAILCNVNANYVSSVEQLKENMFCQVYSSVLWRQTVEKMINEGVREFVEIGPGKTLTNIIKKINGNVLTATINKVEALEKYKLTSMN